MNIEFKYDVNPENTIKQLSGELRGLKPLNRSRMTAEVSSGKLGLHITHLDPMFFGQNPNTGRDDAFKLLQETFSQTTIWAKVTDDGKELKLQIPETTTIERVGSTDELIIAIPVETEDDNYY